MFRLVLGGRVCDPAQAATVADEAVILRKKPIDIEQTHDLSVLVGIGREILMLLKCILALVF